MLDKTTPIFDTATDTVTDLVNIKLKGKILQDATLLWVVQLDPEAVAQSVDGWLKVF